MSFINLYDSLNYVLNFRDCNSCVSCYSDTVLIQVAMGFGNICSHYMVIFLLLPVGPIKRSQTRFYVLLKNTLDDFVYFWHAK